MVSSAPWGGASLGLGLCIGSAVRVCCPVKSLSECRNEDTIVSYLFILTFSTTYRQGFDNTDVIIILLESCQAAKSPQRWGVTKTQGCQPLSLGCWVPPFHFNHHVCLKLVLRSYPSSSSSSSTPFSFSFSSSPY